MSSLFITSSHTRNISKETQGKEIGEQNFKATYQIFSSCPLQIQCPLARGFVCTFSNEFQMPSQMEQLLACNQVLNKRTQTKISSIIPPRTCLTSNSDSSKLPLKMALIPIFAKGIHISRQNSRLQSTDICTSFLIKRRN